MMEKTRRCTKCGETKPLEMFPVVDSARGYRRHWCALCESQRKVDYYNANHTEIREKQKSARAGKRTKRDLTAAQLAERNLWQRIYREKHKAMVMEAYGNKCACCGETEPFFLSIDHVNNDGFMARKHKLHPTDTLNFYRWLVKNDFPKDFQILCMNCNFGKARNGGVCPHLEPSTTIPSGSTAQAIGAGSAPRPESCQGEDIV